MPKKTKLSKKDLKAFKDLLIKKKVKLLQGMNHLTNETLKKSQREASGDLSGYAYHMADMASDVYERDFLLQLASGERELLFKLIYLKFQCAYFSCFWHVYKPNKETHKEYNRSRKDKDPVDHP